MARTLRLSMHAPTPTTVHAPAPAPDSTDLTDIQDLSPFAVLPSPAAHVSSNPPTAPSKPPSSKKAGTDVMYHLRRCAVLLSPTFTGALGPSTDLSEPLPDDGSPSMITHTPFKQRHNWAWAQPAHSLAVLPASSVRFARLCEGKGRGPAHDEHCMHASTVGTLCPAFHLLGSNGA